MGRTCSTNWGEEECIYDNGGKEGKNHWEDQDVGGWTILKWILERYDGTVGIGLIWLRIGTSGRLL
jgi:hypothetical protein